MACGQQSVLQGALFLHGIINLGMTPKLHGNKNWTETKFKQKQKLDEKMSLGRTKVVWKLSVLFISVLFALNTPGKTSSRWWYFEH